MEYYNAISAGYNELYGEEQKNKLRIIKQHVNVNKNDILLDVGCGTGVSSDFNCCVVGIDPSVELLKQFKTDEKRRCLVGYAEALPFRDRSFDKVVCLSSIQNFKDIPKGLKEIRRVGKDHFVISVLKKSLKFKFIEENIGRLFKVTKMIEEEHDDIFLMERL